MIGGGGGGVGVIGSGGVGVGGVGGVGGIYGRAYGYSVPACHVALATRVQISAVSRVRHSCGVVHYVTKCYYHGKVVSVASGGGGGGGGFGFEAEVCSAELVRCGVGGLGANGGGGGYHKKRRRRESSGYHDNFLDQGYDQAGYDQGGYTDDGGGGGGGGAIDGGSARGGGGVIGCVDGFVRQQTCQIRSIGIGAPGLQCLQVRERASCPPSFLLSNQIFLAGADLRVRAQRAADPEGAARALPDRRLRQPAPLGLRQEEEEEEEAAQERAGGGGGAATDGESRIDPQRGLHLRGGGGRHRVA